jgi:hypothetical protein
MKKIEIILDECIDQIRAGGSMDKVLEKYPDQAEDLRSLLRITHDLEAMPDPNGSKLRGFSRVKRVKTREGLVEVFNA